METEQDFITQVTECQSFKDINTLSYNFAKQAGFKHYFLLGSFFNNYSNPFSRSLSNYCKTTKQRNSPDMYNMLAETIQFSLNSISPVVRGKLRTKQPYRRKLPANILHIKKHDLHSSISFPVHFPSGRFGLFQLGTHRHSNIDYETVLVYGYFFATKICKQLLNLINTPFPDVLLSERERSCLTMACDGINARSTSKLLGLSEHTIQYYLKNARRKLHSHNLQQAISHAISQGEIKPFSFQRNGLPKILNKTT